MENVLLKELDILHHTGKEIAFAMITAASKRGISYACWRLPQQTELFVLVDFTEVTQKKKPQLEKSEQGFVIQPFLQHGLDDTIFLNADLLFTSEDRSFTFSSEVKNPMESDSFLKAVQEELKKGTYEVVLTPCPSDLPEDNTSDFYTNLVTKAKEAIQENRFKKIVLARKKKIKPDASFQLLTALKEISKAYANAFISLVYTKSTGTWLTASPEILASINKEGIFRTIALAGTQSLKKGESIQKAVWTQKEIEEQALVCRYIINCFKKIRLREYEEEGPRTVQSGDLWHLRTDYTVNTRELNFPELGTVMLELLHPTSAVCGMPKEVTLEFIKEHEHLDRSLFSGYLGPVNIQQESHIFVNLRCAHLFSDAAILYAGAGVTQDSESEKEYNETELKMEAVGRFFKSNNS